MFIAAHTCGSSSAPGAPGQPISPRQIHSLGLSEKGQRERGGLIFWVIKCKPCKNPQRQKRSREEQGSAVKQYSFLSVLDVSEPGPRLLCLLAALESKAPGYF